MNDKIQVDIKLMEQLAIVIGYLEAEKQTPINLARACAHQGPSKYERDAVERFVERMNDLNTVFDAILHQTTPLDER